MEEDNHQPPGLTTLLGRLGRTGLGVLRNRAELLSVEWQEEKARLSRLLILALGMMLLGVMAIGLLIATIVVLLPADYRVYALGGFTLLLAGACAWAWICIKGELKKTPFEESIEQVRKDAGLLDN